MRSARVLTLRSEWPPEHRWALELFLASPESEGMRSLYTPRFLFLSKPENQLLHTTAGFDSWARDAKPWLDRRVGA